MCCMRNHYSEKYIVIVVLLVALFGIVFLFMKAGESVTGEVTETITTNEIVCTDTDGGFNPRVKGSTMSNVNKEEFTDYCHGEALVEYYCDTTIENKYSQLTYFKFKCMEKYGSSFFCLHGACFEDSNGNGIIDSDEEQQQNALNATFIADLQNQIEEKGAEIKGSTTLSYKLLIATIIASLIIIVAFGFFKKYRSQFFGYFLRILIFPLIIYTFYSLLVNGSILFFGFFFIILAFAGLQGVLHSPFLLLMFFLCLSPFFISFYLLYHLFQLSSFLLLNKSIPQRKRLATVFLLLGILFLFFFSYLLLNNPIFENYSVSLSSTPNIENTVFDFWASLTNYSIQVVGTFFQSMCFFIASLYYFKIITNKK